MSIDIQTDAAGLPIVTAAIREAVKLDTAPLMKQIVKLGRDSRLCTTVNRGGKTAGQRGAQRGGQA